MCACVIDSEPYYYTCWRALQNDALCSRFRFVVGALSKLIIACVQSESAHIRFSIVGGKSSKATTSTAIFFRIHSKSRDVFVPSRSRSALTHTHTAHRSHVRTHNLCTRFYSKRNVRMYTHTKTKSLRRNALEVLMEELPCVSALGLLWSHTTIRVRIKYKTISSRPQAACQWTRVANFNFTYAD